ncbi:MAG: hypothetical protein LUC43_02605, partial [Burkholderiales bacterium]|nr:hypothetical protein [Burkholderiales bacterium]
NDVPADKDKEWNFWYNSQHLDERYGIPGFLSAKRYIALPGEADRKYVATYETESADTLKSTPYMKRLDSPTPLTKANAPNFLRMNRSLMDILWQDGKGMGAILDLIVIHPVPQTLKAIQSNLKELWQNDSNKAQFERATYLERAYPPEEKQETAESKLRAKPDEEFEAVLLLEWGDLPGWPAPRLIDKLEEIGIDVDEKASGRYRLINIRGYF